MEIVKDYRSALVRALNCFVVVCATITATRLLIRGETLMGVCWVIIGASCLFSAMEGRS
jgi:hypothetical protein